MTNSGSLEPAFVHSAGKAKGTAYTVMATLKLPVCETAGRIGRECDVTQKAQGGEAECVV